MNFRFPLLALAATLLSATGGSRADDGHDHGDAPAAAAGPASPRFAAVSETFELVGVLNGRDITLYLDRAADNSPVRDAKIELDLAGTRYQAVRHGDAEFEVTLAAAPSPGVLPVTATVTAGADTDLLAGELDLHGEHAEDARHGASWKQLLGGAIAALAALSLLGYAARRMAMARRARPGASA